MVVGDNEGQRAPSSIPWHWHRVRRIKAFAYLLAASHACPGSARAFVDVVPAIQLSGLADLGPTLSAVIGSRDPHSWKPVTTLLEGTHGPTRYEAERTGVLLATVHAKPLVQEAAAPLLRRQGHALLHA